MVENNNNIRLCLVLTEGMSFQLWDKYGLLYREIALYRELINHGVHTTFVSFGNSDELKYKDVLSGFDIIYNRWGLPSYIYIKCINLLNFKKLKNIDIVKTNQVESINTATNIAKFWGKPILGRMGYLKSFNKKKMHGDDSKIYKDATKLEKKLALNSSKIILTSQQLKEGFENSYPKSHDKIIVIPNFVDTTIFKPDNKIEKKYDLLYIGRLAEQKNIKILLKAIIGLKLKILFIGRGLFKNNILRYKKKYNLNLELIDMVPNQELPFYMNSSSIFVLPSSFEGNPKSLLEAMSCEIPVIGANSPGISNLITHNNNGYICEPTIDGIRNAINDLINKVELQNNLSKNARQYILDNHSLALTVESELELYKKVLNS